MWILNWYIWKFNTERMENHNFSQKCLKMSKWTMFVLENVQNGSNAGTQRDFDGIKKASSKNHQLNLRKFELNWGLRRIENPLHLFSKLRPDSTRTVWYVAPCFLDYSPLTHFWTQNLIEITSVRYIESIQTIISTII